MWDERARRLTLLAIGLFLAGRLVVILSADLPVITPDEPGAWAIAKWLSGTEGALVMNEMPRYPLMSGVVLAPLWWLPVGPELRYQLGLVVTGLLTLSAALVVRATLRRLTDDPMVHALGLAVMLLAPAASFATAFTYGEATVLLCVAVVVWGAVGAAAGDTRAMLIGSLAAGSSLATHGRLALVPVIWLAMLVVLTVRGHGPRRRSVALAGLVTLATLAGTVLAHRAAVDALWSAAEPAVKVPAGDWLVEPGLWLAAARELAGQLWYVVIASAGLAVAGVAQMLSMLRRARPMAQRVTAATILAVAASVLFVSTTVMAGYLHASGYADVGQLIPPRLDHLVYGRYNDAVILVLTCLGLWWCWERRPRSEMGALGAVALAVVVVTGVAVIDLADRLALPGYFPTPNTAGLSVVPFGRIDQRLEIFTIGGLVAIGVVSAAAIRSRRALAAVMVCWLVLGGLVGPLDAARMHRYDMPLHVSPLLGPGGGRATVVVASDTADLDWMEQHVFLSQYDLLSHGWRTEFSELDSVALAKRSDASAIALVDGVDPGGGWTHLGERQGVHLWQRPA